MNWILLGLLSAFFAALVAILGKLGIKGLDTTLATTLRSIIMALFLIVIAFSADKIHGVGSVSTRTWWYIIGAGVAGALSWLCYFAALKNGPAGSVAALDRLSVVFVLIIAALTLGEKLTTLKIIGGVLLVAGAILVAI
ncbi:MAG: EamA family transporter [bacterium]|nr:EamA family transporter [bacterium]